MIFADRLVAIDPAGDVHTLMDDGNIEATGGTIAPWITSVTFGGPDLKTVYLGSLRRSSIPYFASPVAGLPMIRW